jgi:hypothetical protein
MSNNGNPPRYQSSPIFIHRRNGFLYRDLDILVLEDPKIVGRDKEGDGEYGEEPP